MGRSIRSALVAGSGAVRLSPKARAKDEQYFARRLAHELHLAGTAPSAAERSVRLGACRYLCTLLDLPVDQAMREIERRPSSLPERST